jgi:HrpA-like RNA helicase
MHEAIAQHAKFVHHDGDHLTLLNVYNQFIKNGSSADWCHKNYIHHRHVKSA